MNLLETSEQPDWSSVAQPAAYYGTVETYPSGDDGCFVSYYCLLAGAARRSEQGEEVKLALRNFGLPDAQQLANALPAPATAAEASPQMPAFVELQLQGGPPATAVAGDDAGDAPREPVCKDSAPQPVCAADGSAGAGASQEPPSTADASQPVSTASSSQEPAIAPRSTEPAAEGKLPEPAAERQPREQRPELAAEEQRSEPPSAPPPGDAFPASVSTGSAPQPVCAPLFTLRDARKLALACTGRSDLLLIRAAYESCLATHMSGYENGGERLVTAICAEQEWQPWIAVRYQEWIGPGIVGCYWQFRSRRSSSRACFGRKPAREGEERQQRLDLIAVRADCSLLELHPGTQWKTTPPPVLWGMGFVP